MTREIEVTLLTGGGDRPYAFGLATSLMSHATAMEIIGSDDLDCLEFHSKPEVRFLNLRGSQRPDVSLIKKALRVSTYYLKLIRYASTAKPKIFHILWNNKFAAFDRTLLTLYYKSLGKAVVLTLHNVNAGRRDGRDSYLNRLTLRIQYRLANHIFVHTKKMERELVEEFGVQVDRITVIPFGINNAVPNTDLSPADARQRLGVENGQRTILFFGNITPYKGLEYLIAAFKRLAPLQQNYQLIIAGQPNRCERYWNEILSLISEDALRGRVLLRAEFIPDDETEVYFKAADVLVLPYKHIYQSGVLFLAYSFGLPVLAADVGSLKDEILEGRTGLVFRPEDPVDLVRAIKSYFVSSLYANLNCLRPEIRKYAAERNSWSVVAQRITRVYADLMTVSEITNRGTSRTALTACESATAKRRRRL